MINDLLKREEFLQKPPILLDIGASGELPDLWKQISKHCVCIAFDADEREFAYIEEKKQQFKKLIIIDKIVSDVQGDVNFYLTKSPYCSSTLQPNKENLSNYQFASLFEIDRIIRMQSVLLTNILLDNSINYIDWYKTDTQGTDLRIIQSLQKKLIESVIVYELEPGIINAYKNEDKFSSVLNYFDEMDFIATDAVIKGSCRINMNLACKKLSSNLINNITHLLPKTPDWCEISFFNPFKNNDFTTREYILGWIFAILKKQFGLALEIAEQGFQTFHDKDFNKMMDFTINEIDNLYQTIILKKNKKNVKEKIIRFINK